MNTDELKIACRNALRAYPNDIARYRAGKTALIGLFTGHVMKETKGKADPEATITMLTEMLASDIICLGDSCG